MRPYIFGYGLLTNNEKDIFHTGIITIWDSNYPYRSKVAHYGVDGKPTVICETLLDAHRRIYDREGQQYRYLYLNDSCKPHNSGMDRSILFQHETNAFKLYEKSYPEYHITKSSCQTFTKNILGLKHYTQSELANTPYSIWEKSPAITIMGMVAGLYHNPSLTVNIIEKHLNLVHKSPLCEWTHKIDIETHTLYQIIK